ncbi:membrane protein [Candidatus Mancarchaeum acidiphilum]|uniref:Membrane protein n=1 Tax=Candidatus Mancarchaeum acidiphilum TaxID=1920749 RepID=A0A218NM00_9ARCH|nr:hypothetical protein [Candidatus Mancarchaeum acidiphilum]ASI13500.1 membrane protein [Candidatus Mancarchaeum acidiphilum]
MSQEELGREFFISIITVLMTIISIIVFIIYGGNYLFYIFISLTIIIGVVNAWMIDKKSNKEELAKGKPSKKEKLPSAKVRNGKKQNPKSD